MSQIKLPKTTTKQQEIILLLFKFRFLNRAQIQKLLGNKSPGAINRLLKDLTEKEYINSIYSPTYPDNLKPAIYYLAGNGISYLKTEMGRDPSALKNLYNEKLRTETFANRCMLLADIFLGLESKENAKLKYTLYPRCDYPDLPIIKDFLADISPDAYLIRKKPSQTKYYFIEILADLPAQWLRQRIKKYIKLYESSEWETETGKDFPTILIVCPNYRVLDYILNYTRRLLATLDEPTLSINLATVDKMKELGFTGDIWKSA